MVAIEHHQKSSTTAATITTATITVDILSPTSSASSASAASSTTTTTTTSSNNQQQQQDTFYHKTKQHPSKAAKMSANQELATEATVPEDRTDQAAIAEPSCSGSGGGGGVSAGAGAVSKSAVSQRNVDIKIAKKTNVDATTKELTKKVLKLDLTGKELDENSVKSPKSPVAARLPHQSSLTSSVDVEDRKTLREALYQGIFHRHRRTIFAVGSFLRMLRSRNSQYNTIRSSSEGEDVDEVR